MREPWFQNVCNGKIKGFGPSVASTKKNKNSKCHFTHHFDPFLKLGPFHLEVKLYYPFRTIVHDFFTEKEMNWMMEYDPDDKEKKISHVYVSLNQSHI